MDSFYQNSYKCFPPTIEVTQWAQKAAQIAQQISEDPEQKARWLRCSGTWFAGVNVFGNDKTGGIPEQGLPPLPSPILAALKQLSLPQQGFDPAQISICYPNYPKPWPEMESEAAYRYRRNRDAAHVDGLHRIMPGRRRKAKETHGFILGIPLTNNEPEDSPFVVWEGSHEPIRIALSQACSEQTREWSDVDVTEAYTETRKQIFNNYKRIPLFTPLGGFYIVHRLALHGVAPWGQGNKPRIIAYFRPDTFQGDVFQWLSSP